MPNYKFHTVANLVLGTPLIYYGLFQQHSTSHELVAIAGVSFVVATLLLSPDLDLKHSRITKNWGVLGPLWWGYNRFFKHRGLSHSLFLSSLTRLLYLFFVAVIFFLGFHLASGLIAGNHFQDAFNATQERLSDSLKEGYSRVIDNKNYIIAIAVGIVVSDWMHIMFDRVLTASKSVLTRAGLR